MFLIIKWWIASCIAIYVFNYKGTKLWDAHALFKSYIRSKLVIFVFNFGNLFIGSPSLPNFFLWHTRSHTTKHFVYTHSILHSNNLEKKLFIFLVYFLRRWVSFSLAHI